MIRPVTCPICDKELPAQAADSQDFPFCSRKCREIDLLRWSKGQYAVTEQLPPELLEHPDLLDELRNMD